MDSILKRGHGVYLTKNDTKVRQAIAQACKDLGIEVQGKTLRGENAEKYPSIVFGRKDRITGCNDPLYNEDYTWIPVHEFLFRARQTAKQ